MKKTLLFLMALIITGYANAQLKLTKKLYDKNLNAEFIKEMPLAPKSLI
jgi:hypothetical protein